MSNNYSIKFKVRTLGGLYTSVTVPISALTTDAINSALAQGYFEGRGRVRVTPSLMGSGLRGNIGSGSAAVRTSPSGTGTTT